MTYSISWRPSPAATPRSRLISAPTSRPARRIRRERWRSEQQVDRLFNVASAAAILLVIGGAVAMLNVQSIMTAATGAWSVLSVFNSQVAAQALPVLATYAAAGALLVSVVGMWWWAERRLSL